MGKLRIIICDHTYYHILIIRVIRVRSGHVRMTGPDRIILAIWTSPHKNLPFAFFSVRMVQIQGGSQIG